MGNEITVKMKENMPVVALLEQSGLIGQKKAGSDLHIPASVWNSFAAEIGKNPVKNYITDKNAEISVSKYLEKASKSEQDKIADYFGFYKATKEEAAEYDEKAVELLKELAKNPSDLKFKKFPETTNPMGTIYTTIRAQLPDHRGMQVIYAKDSVTGENKLLNVDVNFDTTKNIVSRRNLALVDREDAKYWRDGEFVYSTPKIKLDNGMDSKNYDITGVDFKRVAELAEQILKNYNGSEK